MELKFYNTISGEKENFLPENKNNVKIYSCGPTVYNFNHIGNFRYYVFCDVLRRSLKLLGYTPDHSMNITDIEDKIIRDSLAENKSVEEFTQKWTQIFFEDLETLGIEKIEHYPKATESIPDMIDIIDKLEKRNMIYEKDGSVYYSISKFSGYGKLSKIDTTGMVSGTRYDTDEYEKEDLRDFVLWKAPKLEKEKFWETKYGNGRPGWHLECSAMIRKIYKSGIDIHTGGVDLLFPHHENEIAQSEGAYPEDKFVKTWLHCEHLLVEGEKMSKSKGNYYTLRDLLEKGYDKKSIRYLLLSYHYRTKLNFSLSRLEESKKAISKIQNTVDRVMEARSHENIQQKEPENFAKSAFEEFKNGISDDLNIAKSLGTVFDFLKTVNSGLDSGSLSAADLEDVAIYFKKINSVLAILDFEKKPETLVDEEIENLMAERAKARQDKNFKRSDEIRDLLLSRGILIEDTKTGVKWKRN
ncbi:MAG: cysteine--tRNA ligase [Leptospira sp.]|nr:cysteine--tRNA ligase [Leptospira sp.]